jgi:hypothetical protein
MTKTNRNYIQEETLYVSQAAWFSRSIDCQISRGKQAVVSVCTGMWWCDMMTSGKGVQRVAWYTITALVGQPLHPPQLPPVGGGCAVANDNELLVCTRTYTQGAYMSNPSTQAAHKAA